MAHQEMSLLPSCSRAASHAIGLTETVQSRLQARLPVTGLEGLCPKKGSGVVFRRRNSVRSNNTAAEKRLPTPFLGTEPAPYTYLLKPAPIPCNLSPITSRRTLVGRGRVRFRPGRTRNSSVRTLRPR